MAKTGAAFFKGSDYRKSLHVGNASSLSGHSFRDSAEWGVKYAPLFFRRIRVVRFGRGRVLTGLLSTCRRGMGKVRQFFRKKGLQALIHAHSNSKCLKTRVSVMGIHHLFQIL